MHPDLIEQGFLVAVTGKKGPLFYDPANHRGGTDGNPQHKKTAERLGKWVRSLGIKDDEVQPNHGWRHRFKYEAKAVRMDPETRDAIQGHAPRTEGEKYAGGRVPLHIMLEEISKLPCYDVT